MTYRIQPMINFQIEISPGERCSVCEQPEPREKKRCNVFCDKGRWNPPSSCSCKPGWTGDCCHVGNIDYSSKYFFPNRAYFQI